MSETVGKVEVQISADAVIHADGKPYMRDAKGKLVPLELVKPQDKLEDETVRKIMWFAEALSEQIARFKGHTFTDLGEFDALLEQDYGTKRGGAKGNRTYQTFDGCLKVDRPGGRLHRLRSAAPDRKEPDRRMPERVVGGCPARDPGHHHAGVQYGQGRPNQPVRDLHGCFASTSRTNAGSSQCRLSGMPCG